MCGPIPQPSFRCPLCERRFNHENARNWHITHTLQHANAVEAIGALRYQLADAHFLLAEAQETIEALRRQRDAAREDAVV